METLAKMPLFEGVLSRLALSSGGVYSILDFGCGTGDFLGLVSKSVNTGSKLIGIDEREQFIKEARIRYPDVNFTCEEFVDRLNLPDMSFDIIATIDVLECVSDKEALLNEFCRILKPGGNMLAAHWDWDTMVYSAENKDIARKAVSAFANWKQPWMDHCDGQMGRKLWGLFEGSGKFRGEAASFNLIETVYEKGKYGFDRMQDIAKMVDGGGIEKNEHERLNRELIERDARGQYFFCVTSFIYYGEKV